MSAVLDIARKLLRNALRRLKELIGNVRSESFAIASSICNIRIVAFLLFAMLTTHAHAGELRQAYIDKIGNVHVVGVDGEDSAITDDGLARHVRMAPNGKFVVWLVRDYAPRDGSPRDDASMFGAYDGTFAGFVDCEQPIRRLWFWNGGENIGIECGRKGAAVFELLYDAATLEIVDSFDRSKTPAKRQPQWSVMSSAGRN